MWPAPERNEILWDTWGVPHVYGTTTGAVFRGFGRAQAEAHGDLLLLLYGQARGRAAEYWGEGHWDSDRWVRTMGLPELARRWLQAQDDEMRLWLDAFASGINAWAAEHPDALSPDARVVLPVDALDVVAHGIRALHLTFVVGPDVIRDAERAVQEAAAGDAGSAPPGRSEPVRLALDEGAWRSEAVGSNAWAVSPDRSASGNALLVANPHLPWGGVFTWFESHLVGPGLDLSGATLVGVPVPAIAFNDRLGWSHTVNTYDGADLYLLTLAEEGRSYRFDGGLRPLETSVDSVLVKEEDGSLLARPLPLIRSLHGPVLVTSAGHAVALRVAGLDASGVIRQWWEMGRAGDLEAFQAALSMNQLPMFNVVYADADGHVLYFYAGRVPRRAEGDVARWEGVVDGESASTLWSAVLGFEELPRVVDPATGWLHNANDPPWTATLPRPLERERFPAYLSPDFMHFRAQRSAGMLEADASITWEELHGYKHSTRMLLADRVLDDLLPLAAASPLEAVRRAGEVLAAWDRSADAGSRGVVLFQRWADLWIRSAGFAPGAGPPFQRALAFRVPWSAADPAATPVGIADADAALAALGQAAGEVEARHGALDVAFGDVHRLQVGGRDLPANGAAGDPWGVFRVTAYAQAADGRQRAVGGDSYYALVEFGRPVRAKALVAYGNASRPGSPHLGDQTELYAAKTMRTVWLDRRDVERNLEKRERY